MATRSDPSPQYIIGFGEKLTKEERFVTSLKPEKAWPYEPREAARRLMPRLASVVRSLESVPPAACPRGEPVALITLHPEALARTYFPEKLLAHVGLRAVGCRARVIKPEKWSAPRARDQAKEVETIELYVAGPRIRFEDWEDSLDSLSPMTIGADELPRIEDVRSLEDLDAGGRIKPAAVHNNRMLLEASLHDDALSDFDVFAEFFRYAGNLGVEILRDAMIAVPGIIFVPLRVTREALTRLSRFSFLRSLRPAAKLRTYPQTSFFEAERR